MSEGALIAPCLCRGSAKYAHASCLQRWLRVKSARAPGEERWIITCQVCQSHFRLRIAYKREGKRNFNKCHIFEGGDVRFLDTLIILCNRKVKQVKNDADARTFGRYKYSVDKLLFWAIRMGSS